MQIFSSLKDFAAGVKAGMVDSIDAARRSGIYRAGVRERAEQACKEREASERAPDRGLRKGRAMARATARIARLERGEA